MFVFVCYKWFLMRLTSYKHHTFLSHFADAFMSQIGHCYDFLLVFFVNVIRIISISCLMQH